MVVDNSRWSEIIDFDGTIETNQLPLSVVDGIQCRMELEDAHFPAPAGENIKQCWKEYLLEFVKQMKQRMPTNMQQLQCPSSVFRKKTQLTSVSFL